MIPQSALSCSKLKNTDSINSVWTVLRALDCKKYIMGCNSCNGYVLIQIFCFNFPWQHFEGVLEYFVDFFGS
jgi:hypothetical protein